MAHSALSATVCKHVSQEGGCLSRSSREVASALNRSGGSLAGERAAADSRAPLRNVGGSVNDVPSRAPPLAFSLLVISFPAMLRAGNGVCLPSKWLGENCLKAQC